MENQDLLKQELEKAETTEAVQEIVESAELYGETEVAELAKKKLEAILAKVTAVETTPPAQVTQVESVGGSSSEIATRTAAVDAQIDAVKTETESKIAEVQGEASPVVERPPIPPLPEKKIEIGSEKSQEEIEAEQLKIDDEKFMKRIQLFLDANKKNRVDEGPKLLKKDVEKHFLDGGYGYSIHEMRLMVEGGLIKEEEVFTGIQNTRDRLIRQDTYDKTNDPEQVAKRTDADMGIIFWEQAKTPKDIKYISKNPKIDDALRLGVAKIMDPRVGGFATGEREKLQKMISKSGYAVAA